MTLPLLNEHDISKVDINWQERIDIIESIVKCLQERDYVQPLKTYLRYNDLKNRIIAMPGYVGGGFDVAGLKWISSFPGNIKNGRPRAHSVLVLNHATTGQPMGIINTPLLSVLRTAAVSGLLIRYFLKNRNLHNLKIGIIGWGPIGQYHLKMCEEILKGKIDKVYLYDKRTIEESTLPFDKDKIIIADNWELPYKESDIFITCTVADAPYIHGMPKELSLHLNVSLRDYKSSTYEFFRNGIVVDNWEEVCRENTDIERMAIEQGLTSDQCYSIIDVVTDNILSKICSKGPVMFNPMGMSVFDIGLGYHYLKCIKSEISPAMR